MFNLASYERHLALERERLGLNLAVVFNSGKHPRDIHGRFRNLQLLKESDGPIKLDNGYSVQKKGVSYFVAKDGKDVAATGVPSMVKSIIQQHESSPPPSLVPEDSALPGALEHAHVAVRVFPKALRGILEHGAFKSVHDGEVHSTGLGEDRRAVEQKLFNIPADAPVSAYPLYGYMAPDREVGVGGPDDVALSGYGNIRLTLKPRVRDRTTVTYGDSLMIPDAKPVPLSTLKAQPGEGEYDFDPNGVYHEAQIYGGIKASDIAHVHFGLGPPDAETRALMAKHGIHYTIDAEHRINKAHDDEWGMGLSVFQEADHPRGPGGKFKGAAMEIVGWHGTTHGPIVGAFKNPDLFVGHIKDLADSYAETSDKDRTHAVSYKADNALILDTPEAFQDAWVASGADKAPMPFHPNATGALTKWAREHGYDAVHVPESAFDGDLGYELVGGTLGEPQSILLDPSKAQFDGDAPKRLDGPSAEANGYEPLDSTGVWLMSGGCAHLAVAMQMLHPELKIGAAWYNDHGSESLAHAWAYDPETGRAFDGAGVQSPPEAPSWNYTDITRLEMDESQQALADQMGFQLDWSDDNLFEAAEFAQEHFHLA